jgi:hypothetical protein
MQVKRYEAFTSDVIDSPPHLPQTAVMNLHTFLIVDSVLLDVAGVVALLEGETALGVTLFVVAALAFIGALARRRQLQASA